jgi:hypothetical protein
MNDKTKTAAKPKPVPAAKKPKSAPRFPAMTLAQKFDLMTEIKSADATKSDAALASELSTKFSRPVMQVTVAEYRKQFGLASVRKPSAAALEAHVAALKAQLANAGILPVSVPAEPVKAVETIADGSAAATGEAGPQDGAETA